jgi:glyceraldehyde-3-phosphate dehydrogenase (NAD(P))
MRVEVVGPGTIGARVADALLRVNAALGIEEVIVFKRTFDPQYMSDLWQLKLRGAKLAVKKENFEEFARVGLKADYEEMEALGGCDVIVDCTTDGEAGRFRERYEEACYEARGLICQGSKKDRGFGKRLFVYGVNLDAVNFKRDRFIQLGSCNTHACAILTQAFLTRFPLEDIEWIFFDVDRRDHDLNQPGASVQSIEVCRFDDPLFGTHQAADVAEVFSTKGIALQGRIVSATKKVAEPYFHSGTFKVDFRRRVSKGEVEEALRGQQPLIIRTTRGLDHYNFEACRRWCSNSMGTFYNLACVHDCEVFDGADGRSAAIGRFFTPQDGNVVLSNVAAISGYIHGVLRGEVLELLERTFLLSLPQIEGFLSV